MSLLEKIKADQITARKAKDKYAITVLTTLYAESQRPGLDDGKRESTDVEVIKVIKKFIKGVDETMAINEDADLLPEKFIYQMYLPPQFNTHTLSKIIELIVRVDNLEGMKNMGKVMSKLKADHDGLYDGKEAARLVKEHLS